MSDNKFYNYKTSNMSFLKISKELKDRGISNFAFPLIIKDPNLIGVDPWSEEVLKDTSLQTRIAIECSENVWYFLREVIKVPTPGGSVKFELHRGNLALIFLMSNNINTAIELPRQHYKTYSAVVYFTWLMLFKAKNYSMIFTHKQYSDTVENLRKLKVLLDPTNECLPPYLIPLKSPGDKDNEEYFLLADRNNSIKCIGPSNNAIGADKAGRGMTVPTIWIDETAFVSFIKQMYNSMAPAFSTASRFAKEHGSPYGILLSTTPSSLDIDEGVFFHDIIMGSSLRFNEKFYDWHEDKGIEWLKTFIEDNSGNDFVYIEFSYKELGKDDKWLAQQIRLLNNDMAMVKRELLLEWTLTNDNSIFSEEVLNNISQYSKDTEYEAQVLIKDKFSLSFIKLPKDMNTKSYVISVDIGGGLRRDKTVITVIDPLSFEPIATMGSNVLDTVTLVEVISEILTLYFRNSVLVPELNYTGEVFVELFRQKYPNLEKHLFYTLKEHYLERKIEGSETGIRLNPKRNSKKKTQVRKFGINTNIKTRDIMINDILLPFTDERPEVFNNKEIFQELKTLERKKNGKIEHSSSGHDDYLFSYLIGVYAIIYENRTMRSFLKVTNMREEDFEEDSEIVAKRRKTNSMFSKMNSLVHSDENINPFGEVKIKFEEELANNKKIKSGGLLGRLLDGQEQEGNRW